eukprot:TRINITY_DN28531_c0_g1_i1.p1 TRINITY_DN28531_c0_g1~~TRINITY_DN28531_c0_g1_i1.p1  ORF type:complete len:424 (-),score=92.38 TRINITY_DN28531_c0_g1_i1:100-1371(-)
MVTHGGEIPLEKKSYGVAISWDEGARKVDVDIQAVIVDNSGQVVDAVYYNNMKALKCVTHSGDELTGQKSGFDEVIWVNFRKMPEHIGLIIFVLAAYSGGHLSDARNGVIHILEDNKDNQVANVSMQDRRADVDVICMMVRGQGNSAATWSLQYLSLPQQSGKHFMDVLEPTIGGVVRSVIPGAPKRLKVAFAMQKGSMMDLAENNETMSIVSAALGWDTADDMDIDLDVSALVFDEHGKNKDTIFFGNLEGHGIQHTGDNLTGEGDGDDELIHVRFTELPSWANQIVFIVNIYTKGLSFEAVRNPYCRILDATGTELARYQLREARRESGLIIARLYREPCLTRWGFQAIGTFCRGNTWKDSLGDVHKVVMQKPLALQMRSSSSGSLGETSSTAGSYAGAARSEAVTSPTPSQKKSSACVLQ